MLTKKVLKAKRSKGDGGRTSKGFSSFLVGAASSSSLASDLAGAAFFSYFGARMGLKVFWANLTAPTLLTTCGSLKNFSKKVVTLGMAFLKPGSKAIWKGISKCMAITISATVMFEPTR